MPQLFKNKGGHKTKAHQKRKNKPSERSKRTDRSRSDISLTKNIHRAAEDLIIGKAKQSKIRLKIAG